MYFLILLKRARVPINDIVNFYSTCIRPVLEYCAPVFHHALPTYLSDELERVQKGALSIISPNDVSYHERLSLCNLGTLKDRRIELCNNFFDSIMSEPCHKLSYLLPHLNEPHYCLRKQRQFKRPVTRTKRYMNAFSGIYFCSLIFSVNNLHKKLQINIAPKFSRIYLFVEFSLLCRLSKSL